jgi:iron complex transport system ATP-binding protein
MKDGKFCKEGPKDDILTSRNISKLFGARVEIKRKQGYYYALRA